MEVQQISEEAVPGCTTLWEGINFIPNAHPENAKPQFKVIAPYCVVWHYHKELGFIIFVTFLWVAAGCCCIILLPLFAGLNKLNSLNLFPQDTCCRPQPSQLLSAGSFLVPSYCCWCVKICVKS